VALIVYNILLRNVGNGWLYTSTLVTLLKLQSFWMDFAVDIFCRVALCGVLVNRALKKVFEGLLRIG
jgi:hypothetical protein